MAYTAISQSDQTSCLNFLVGNTQRCLATDELLDFSKCDVYTNDNCHLVEEKKKIQHLCFPPSLAFLFRGIVNLKCSPFLVDFLITTY